MSTDLISIRNKSLKLQTRDECTEIIKLIEDHPKATSICLCGNSLGLGACKLIGKALQSNTTLIEADFSDIFTGKLSEEIPYSIDILMQSLKNKPNFTNLILSDNAFGFTGIKPIIDFITENTTLRVLNINDTGLCQRSGIMIAYGLHGIPLEQLIIGRNRLEDLGAKALAVAIEEMKTLTHISLSCNGITPDGMIPLIQAFIKNPNLETIDIYDNNVGSKGAPFLVQSLDSLKCLKKINFGDCLIDAIGSLQIVEKLKDFTIIEELDLSFNNLTDHAIPHLLTLIEHNPLI